MPGERVAAAADERLTIAPPPAAAMRGTNAWQQWTVPRTLTRSTASASSSACPTSGPNRQIPALLTNAAAAPTASASAATPDASETSQTCARPPTSDAADAAEDASTSTQT